MALLKRIAFAWLLILIALICLFPFHYAVITSLKSGSALFQVDYWLDQADWENYRAIFTEGLFGRSILNSLAAAGLTVAVSLALALTAAFALARRRFAGRRLLLLTLLGISTFPQVAALSGLFELIRALGLYNRLEALMFGYLLITLPFTVWILTVAMRAIPRDLEEAAALDGAGPLTILVRIFLPLLRPAMISTGLLAFIAAWNEFLFALTFTLSREQRTVPVAIALMSGASHHELPWGRIMAASVVVTIPVALLAILFQRRIVSGLAAGAVKQ